MPFVKNNNHMATLKLPCGVALDARQVAEVTEAELVEIRESGLFSANLSEVHPAATVRVLKSPGVVAAAEAPVAETVTPPVEEVAAPAPAVPEVAAPTVEAPAVETPVAEAPRRGRPRKGN